MKRLIKRMVVIALVASGVAWGQLVPNLGGQRTGISSLQFLKIGVGGRGAALAESMIGMADDVSALYWNPAGLVLSIENAVMVAHAEWLVDLKHDFIGATYHLSTADVIGFSVISLATDDMKITTETQPFGTGNYFRYSDLAFGVSYARKMTHQFSFGVTARYVQENLDVLKIKAVLFDLGTFYSTGLGTARFGVVVTNFGSDVSPQGDIALFDGTPVTSFQSFSPPTVFKLGFAVEPFQDENQRLTTSIQLNHPNDNAENLRFGIEYAWSDWLRIRAGVKRTIGEPFLGADTKSSDDYSFGFGLSAPLGFTTPSFDYAFTNFNQLGAVHRISMSMTY